MTTDFTVPDELLRLADRLDTVAATVRSYIELPEQPWPGVSAREKASEHKFASLPAKRPVLEAHLAILRNLGIAQDHLVALAAILRTPRTVMAVLTVLRTLLAAVASAAYLSEPDIDQLERMRRATNFDLASLTEQMRMMVGATGPSELQFAKEYARLEHRRTNVGMGARQLGWTVNRPSTPMSGWPKDWWIGDKPPEEMKLIGRLLDNAKGESRTAATLYRWLSATTHAQAHSIQAFIDRTKAIPLGDDVWHTPSGLDGKMICTLSATAIGSLTVSISYGCRLFGWPQSPWVNEVVPIFDSIRNSLPTLP